MKNFDRPYYGQQDFTLHESGVLALSDTYTRRFKGRSFVSSGRVVAGDRKKPNAWHYRVYNYNAANGVVVYINGRFTTVRQGCVAGHIVEDSPLMLPVTVPSHVYNATLDRFNERVRGTIDLSVDIAQASSTARMFKASDKVVQLARLARASPKAIGSAWLELQYGWKPLLGTIYDVLDKTYKVVSSGPRTVRARYSESVPTGDTVSQTVEEYGQLSGKASRKGKYTCQIGALIKTRMDDSAAAYTSLNPFSIAWELLPYSFVVDWFYDVGGYLRNMETCLLYRNVFVSGYRSDGCFFDATWESQTSPTSSGWHRVHSDLKQRSFDRTVLERYPAPRLPSFKADLGSSQILNAAALLSQFLPDEKTPTNRNRSFRPSSSHKLRIHRSSR